MLFAVTQTIDDQRIEECVRDYFSSLIQLRHKLLALVTVLVILHVYQGSVVHDKIQEETGIEFEL